MFYSTSLELVKLLTDCVSVQCTHGTQGVLAGRVELGSPPSEVSFELFDFFRACIALMARTREISFELFDFLCFLKAVFASAAFL